MATEITRAEFVAMASRGEVTSEQAVLMNLHGNVVIGGMHYVLVEPAPVVSRVLTGLETDPPVDEEPEQEEVEARFIVQVPDETPYTGALMGDVRKYLSSWMGDTEPQVDAHPVHFPNVVVMDVSDGASP